MRCTEGQNSYNASLGNRGSFDHIVVALWKEEQSDPTVAKATRYQRRVSSRAVGTFAAAYGQIIKIKVGFEIASGLRGGLKLEDVQRGCRSAIVSITSEAWQDEGGWMDWEV
jgi:hypothetical protein